MLSPKIGGRDAMLDQRRRCVGEKWPLAVNGDPGAVPVDPFNTGSRSKPRKIGCVGAEVHRRLTSMRSTSARGEPSSMIRPASNTAMRSQSRSASSMK